MENEVNTPGYWKQLTSRENLRMMAIFVVILFASVLISNATANQSFLEDTAEDVPGDIEDISDDVFENLELLRTTANSIATEIDIIEDAEDIDIFLETIRGSLVEDAPGLIDTITIQSENSGTFQFDLSEINTLDAIESIEGSTSTTVANGAGWSITDETIQYTVTNNTGVVIIESEKATLTTSLAESAQREDLFATTESGYILLITGDNQLISQFNRTNISTSEIDSLRAEISEDVYDAEIGYYTLETDPFINESSFLVQSNNEFNDWLIIGAFPVSEVPTQNYFGTTINLFDVSELGDRISLIVENAVDFLNEDIGWLFRSLRWPIEQVIDGIEDLLLVTPWFIVIAFTTILAGLSSGRKVAYIATVSMFLIGLIGLWDLTMTTLAMLLTSMAFCVVTGIPLGIWSARSDRVNNIVRAVLDAMQTIHPFVYLVPIVVLFGIGKVPGTIATIIFALPPMVRLTNLGIRQVPEDVVEAAKAFGSSDWQLLRNVQIPLALPSIMAGVNQTLMLSLSMVVIVALIAGGGLGQEIFRAIGRADTGRAVVAGIAVLLLAITMDRISQGREKVKNEE